MDEPGRPRPKPSYARFEPKRAPAPPGAPPGASPGAGPAPAAGYAPPVRESGAPWPLYLAGALLLVIAGGAAWGLVRRADPHYVLARDMVSRYELGRQATALNYDNAVYSRALDELAQVAARSVSAEPARKLAEEIQGKRAAFHEHLSADAARHAASREKKAERVSMHAERVAYDVMHPRTVFPECDEGH